MVDWREGVTSALGICAFFYMQNIFSIVVAEIYGRLEEGVGYVCPGYMCILYVKLI